EREGDFISGEMLALLKKQNLNSKLPKYLPENTVVAHKTGELGEYSHDAGIVYKDSGDYIIVVLSKTQKPLDANEKIAQISKAVYDYFKSK
ncbi:MAG: serine hydrolase, partial [Candidatus Pacearchaeota archaeon]